MRFTVAFNRDRDSYQVPLALAEACALERLVTDFYVPAWLSRSPLGRKLRVAHRHMEGLPFASVEWCAPALWKQIVTLRCAKSEFGRLDAFKALDRDLSRQACSVARTTGSGLFLYSGYALECFSAPDMASRRKILFVFHPHAMLSAEVLERDFTAHPEMNWSHALHRREMESSDSVRLDEELSLAHEVICASSFTRLSIERAMGCSKPVTVVPYGCALSLGGLAKEPILGRRPRLLFAGQGVQRKGLHHLLKVWKRRADWDAELTVVASKLDPAAGRLAESSGAAVRLLPALPRDQLQAEFARADVFVMPSLIEGFGLVYLEALAAGCHVIGTENTGLPDIEAPPQICTITPAGDLGRLEASIESAVKLVRSESFFASEVIAFARKRSWACFREQIRAAIGVIKHTA